MCQSAPVEKSKVRPTSLLLRLLTPSHLFSQFFYSHTYTQVTVPV